MIYCTSSPDNRMNPVMMRKSDKVWRPDFFPYTSAVANQNGETVFKPVQEEWSEIEVKFFHQKISGPEAHALLYLIDDKKKVVDQERIMELALKETQNDLKNQQLATENSILK